MTLRVVEKYDIYLKYDFEIGKGSFKTVFRGRDTAKGRYVAWCEAVLNEPDKAQHDKLMREIDILKKLIHPHILQLFDSWQYTSSSNKITLVLITELMTGGTLKDYLPCKIIVICNWGQQILKGLQGLHTWKPTPIIHRDLKCDNIFIERRSGLVKIGDFGLAVLKNKTLMTTAKQGGTSPFIAPEMYDKHYDELVDVYAFGMCLLEMTTGEYPYKECESAPQVMRKKMTGVQPEALESVEETILKPIIVSCIATEKEERYNVQKLLMHPFFGEKFTVEVVDSGQHQSVEEVAGFRIFRSDDKKYIPFVYNLGHHRPEDVVEKLITSGELAEVDRKDALNAILEKTEVLLLLAKGSIKDKQTIQTSLSSGIVSDFSGTDNEPPVQRVQVDYAPPTMPPNTSSISSSNQSQPPPYRSVDSDSSNRRNHQSVDATVQRVQVDYAQPTIPPNASSISSSNQSQPPPYRSVDSDSSSRRNHQSVPFMEPPVQTRPVYPPVNSQLMSMTEKAGPVPLGGVRSSLSANLTIPPTDKMSSVQRHQVDHAPPTVPSSNNRRQPSDSNGRMNHQNVPVMGSAVRIQTDYSQVKPPQPMPVTEVKPPNDQYICWNKNQAKLAPFVESTHRPIATSLKTKNLITDNLYDKIVSLSSGSTENERTALMFHFIEKKLQFGDITAMKEAWSGFIKALKTEWKRIALEMEEEVRQGSREVKVFQSRQETLIPLIQGSLIRFAGLCNSYDALKDSEHSQVTDPHYKCHTEYVNSMMTAIGHQIRENPAVFEQVKSIFLKSGGPLKRVTEKYLKL